MIRIQYATMDDYDYLKTMDKHIGTRQLERKIYNQEILLAKYDHLTVGWLRFGYFWDSMPFMNLLMVVEGFRNQGVGQALVAYWEAWMRREGYKRVMTSTQADESAQHFYRKLDYKDSGALLLEDQAMEIIFIKQL